jgi:hypothetical protein
MPTRLVRGDGLERDAESAQVRERRVEVARRAWEEIPAGRIERRGLGWLVDVETDAVFILYRGAVFGRGSATLIPDRNPALVFYLDDAGEPVVLERLPGTWTEIAARLARRSP